MALINETQIIKTLHKYNPWWTDWEHGVRLSRAYRRVSFYEAWKIMQHKDLRRFVVLSGARRVGKTTIMYQVIEQLLKDGVPSKDILYITFDNPIFKMSTVDELLSVYDSICPRRGTRYIFMDEIQYTDNWQLWMKVLYDSDDDLRFMATGSASPLLQRGAADSGTGRWSVLHIPTLSFFEYCQLEKLSLPNIPDNITIDNIHKQSKERLAELAISFSSLVPHFNRYLTVGGFPELVLGSDDSYAQRMLREDVVDKVIKRDVLTLFQIRNPLLMEKLFLYLCINSSEVFNISTVAKELDNTSAVTIENYLKALEMSNLIYISNPINVGNKGVLKGRPKVFIADAALRNAVLMIEDVLSDETELGLIVETDVYKHLVNHYRGKPVQVGYFRKAKGNQKEVDVVISKPRDMVLCEVKYRNNSRIVNSDAIVELCNDERSNVSLGLVITKKLDDFGLSAHETKAPVLRIPAIVFLYLLGKSELDR